MKLILVNPVKGWKVVELPKKHHYTDLKKLLEIESPLTVVERKVNDEFFDIWLDDEGLYKEEKQLAGCCMNAQELLVGNLLIARHDDEGNTTGLSDKDIDLIKEKIIDKTDYLKWNEKKSIGIPYGEWGVIGIRKGGSFLIYEV